MYGKGCKGSAAPSDSQAREKLALYMYEYLLHIGVQKSAQNFLSEIRWEKSITLGEPPGFLHSWWCVFWDLYCTAPDRREACVRPECCGGPQTRDGGHGPRGHHGGWSPAAQFLPALHIVAVPRDPQPTLRMQGQPPMGLTGAMDPYPRAQTLPRTVSSVGPQGYGGGLWPLPSALANPSLLSMNMGPPGGGGPPGTPIMPSPGDLAWKGVWAWWASGAPHPILMLVVSPRLHHLQREHVPCHPPPRGRACQATFPLGPEGPVATLSTLELHPVNRSLGSGNVDGLPSLSTGPGIPQDDGDMASAGTFLHRFPSESYSPGVAKSV